MSTTLVDPPEFGAANSVVTGTTARPLVHADNTDEPAAAAGSTRQGSGQASFGVWLPGGCRSIGKAWSQIPKMRHASETSGGAWVPRDPRASSRQSPPISSSPRPSLAPRPSPGRPGRLRSEGAIRSMRWRKRGGRPANVSDAGVAVVTSAWDSFCKTEHLSVPRNATIRNNRTARSMSFLIHCVPFFWDVQHGRACPRGFSKDTGRQAAG